MQKKWPERVKRTEEKIDNFATMWKHDRRPETLAALQRAVAERLALENA